MAASLINPKPISRQTIKLYECKTVTLNLKISLHIHNFLYYSLTKKSIMQIIQVLLVKKKLFIKFK